MHKVHLQHSALVIYPTRFDVLDALGKEGCSSHGGLLPRNSTQTNKHVIFCTGFTTRAKPKLPLSEPACFDSRTDSQAGDITHTLTAEDACHVMSCTAGHLPN